MTFEQEIDALNAIYEKILDMIDKLSDISKQLADIERALGQKGGPEE